LRAKTRFYSDVANYLKSGIGINRAVEETGKNIPKNIRNAFFNCIESGNFSILHRNEYKDWFTKLDISFFDIASQTGRWDIFLKNLSNISKKTEENINHMAMSLAYPAFLLHMLFILPNLSIWFLNGLPAFLYKVCFNLSILYALIIAVFFFSNKFLYMALYIPFIGKLLKDNIYSRILFILSIALESGIPITKSISFCDDIMESFPPLKRKFSIVKKHINSGNKISEAFKRARFFPENILTSIDSGENSGSLPEILNREFNFLEQSIDNRVKSGIKVFGIFVYLAVAAAIGYKVISTFSSTLAPGDLL